MWRFMLFFRVVLRFFVGFCRCEVVRFGVGIVGVGMLVMLFVVCCIVLD